MECPVNLFKSGISRLFYIWFLWLKTRYRNKNLSEQASIKSVLRFLNSNIEEGVQKDKLKTLTTNKAVETGIAGHYLRLVNVYKQDKKKVKRIIFRII